MRRARACSRLVANVAAAAVASACASPALAEEMKRVPDVRVGMGLEVVPAAEGPGGVVLYGSAHPLPWLSLGAEGASAEAHHPHLCDA